MPSVSSPTHINQGEILIDVFQGQINGIAELLCNARDLHRFLKVGRDFNTWIKNRIKEYGFEKNIDFVAVKIFAPQNGGAKRGGHNKIEYHLSLNMAKELAMVEKNEQGRKVRRYFIDCEKQVLQTNHSLIDQFNKALLEFEKLEDIASHAGRALSVVGKQLKPKAKDKVTALQGQIQLILPITVLGE